MKLAFNLLHLFLFEIITFLWSSVSTVYHLALDQTVSISDLKYIFLEIFKSVKNKNKMQFRIPFQLFSLFSAKHYVSSSLPNPVWMFWPPQEESNWVVDLSGSILWRKMATIFNFDFYYFCFGFKLKSKWPSINDVTSIIGQSVKKGEKVNKYYILRDVIYERPPTEKVYFLREIFLDLPFDLHFKILNAMIWFSLAL